LKQDFIHIVFGRTLPNIVS